MSSLPKVIASVWNEAHALYISLRREYYKSGPEISNFDNAWYIWVNDRPSNDPEALVHANRALFFYRKFQADHATAAKHTKAQALPERIAYANRSLVAYWMIGADMTRLAGTIEATRPATPENQLGSAPEFSIGNDDELMAHLQGVEASLAIITEAIKAIRAGMVVTAPEKLDEHRAAPRQLGDDLSV